MSWRDRAACRGTDTEAFYAVTPGGSRHDHDEAARDRAAALRVCAVCTVRRPCLDEALRSGEHGIWGGTTERDRRHMRPTDALWTPGESRFGDEHDNPAGASR